ncbi:MAG: MerR family transcriptional regulator [Evtepia gabavorous]
MIPQETTFTIGQFAAIHGIHKKTLMWYDQVGLLSPAFVGENGYRYYSYRQSARLETILMLRALEVSIPEIKTFLSHRSAGELRRLLTEKIAGWRGRSAAWRKSATPWSGSRPPWPGWKPCP